MKQALICCSGGIDSITTAFYVKKKLNYNKIKILFFDYGQRTLRQERRASKKCAQNLGAEFQKIDLEWLGKISNSLINTEEKAKKISRKELKDTKKESQNYYVPCRNQFFITYAMAISDADFVEKKINSDIFLGFKDEGKEPFPDATQEFVDKMNQLTRISSVSKPKILVPLIKKDKEDIIKLGTKLGMNYAETFTCYVGTNNKRSFQHCGTCLSCRLRQEGFYWANISDPTNYKTIPKDFRKVKDYM